MDALREGVYLRGYAQKDPLIEYKDGSLLDVCRSDGQHQKRSACTISFAAPRIFRPSKLFFRPFRNSSCANRADRALANGPFQVGDLNGSIHRLAATEKLTSNGAEVKFDFAPVRRELAKVGRNEPCPCGSGEIQELLRKYRLTTGLSVSGERKRRRRNTSTGRLKPLPKPSDLSR